MEFNPLDFINQIMVMERMERGIDGRGQKFIVSLGYQDYLYRNQTTKSKQINKQTKKKSPT